MRAFQALPPYPFTCAAILIAPAFRNVARSSAENPKILRYSNRQFGPIGADAGHKRLASTFLGLASIRLMLRKLCQQ
jgi:hypothetical protein